MKNSHLDIPNVIPVSHRSRLAVLVLLAAATGLAQEAGAQSKAYEGNYTTSRVSSFGYDPNTGLLTNETVEPNKPDLCVSTTYVYDVYGNRETATTTNCAGASTTAQFTQRSVTTNHTALTQGGVTQPAGVEPGAFPLSITNAKGHAEYRTFDPKFGQPTSLKGPNALISNWVLDGFGRKVAELRADGSAMRMWYCFVNPAGGNSASYGGNTNGGATLEHAGLGNCDTIASGLSGVGTVGDVAHASGVAYFTHTQAYLPNGSVAGPYSRVFYDKRGREIRAVTQAFDGGSGATTGKLIIKDTYYQPSGAVAATTQPYFWDTKRSVLAGTATDLGYGYVYNEYDLLGRPKAQYTADTLSANTADLVDMPSTRPAGLPVRKAAKADFTYDRLSATVTRSITGQTLTETQEKNPEGKVVRTTDAYGAQQVFEYDALGNLKRSFDAMGSSGGTSFTDANVVAINYDERGRKVALNDPDKGIWTYKYNALGDLVEQTDANNATTKLSYDELGRLIVRDAPDHFARSFYDTDAGGAKCSAAVSSKGLLCTTTTKRDNASASASTIERRRNYDALLRPTDETTLMYAGSGAVERRFVSTLAYDPTTKRLQSQTYPSGLVIGFDYTALGFVNRVGDWNGASITTARWTAGTINAWGKAETSTLGNGVIQKNTFEPQTGRMATAGAGNATANNVFNHRYAWDTLNNLTSRADAFGSGGSETADTFGYDKLNRLLSYQVSAPPSTLRNITLTYNAIGSILTRSDVGAYSYRPSGGPLPHAVYAVRGTVNADYTYDSVGNLRTASAGAYQSVLYNSFNQPDSVNGIVGRDGTRYTYVYDEAQQRVVERHTAGVGGSVRTTYKLHPDNAGGLSFEQDREGGSINNRHYVSAGGVSVAMVLTNGEIYASVTDEAGTANPQASAKVVVRVEYWHKDHLGSIVALTDASASVRARYAYDPWGQRRNPDGTFANLAPGDYPNGTDRGFTGHEHLDDVGIVHMNGRLYDPILARFMQADPLVGDMLDMQGYNRYSYVRNRPLSSRDESGYCEFICVAFWVIVGARATGIIDQKTFRGLMAIWIGAFLGPAGWGGTVMSAGEATAVAGFASGVVNSGSLKGGFQGMFSSMMFFGIGEGLGHGVGEAFGSSAHLERVALHALAGCAQSKLSGGGCRSGALGAAAGAVATPILSGISDDFANTLAHAVVGGTASVLGGGKFGNGALSSAFGYLFNAKGGALEALKKGAEYAAKGAKWLAEEVAGGGFSPTPGKSTELTFVTDSGVRIRIDSVFIDAKGAILFGEAKIGDYADLTKNQKAAFTELQDGKGKFVGEGATDLRRALGIDAAKDGSFRVPGSRIAGVYVATYERSTDLTQRMKNHNDVVNGRTGGAVMRSGDR